MDFEIDWPFEIVPGLVLRKPSQDEISKIQRLVAESCFSNAGWVAPYETNWIPVEQEDRTSHKVEPIKNQESWKYWLLQDDMGGNLVFDFDRILKLLNPSIELAVRFIYLQEKGKKESHGHSPVRYQIGERHWGTSRISYSTKRIGQAMLTPTG